MAYMHINLCLSPSLSLCQIIHTIHCPPSIIAIAVFSISTRKCQMNTKRKQEKKTVKTSENFFMTFC